MTIKAFLYQIRKFIATKNKDYHPVIKDMVSPYIINPDARVMEIGCWDGESAIYYKEMLQINEIYGVDCFEDCVYKAARKGVKSNFCDLEKDRIPFENDYFDLIIANQVFEHLKNIYFPLTEIYRVIKPNGLFLIGVPNLASLHNRLLLLFGRQPTCIQLFEAHVRAFTPRSLIKFITFNGLFSLVRYKGLGFYPFIPPFSTILSKIFPNSSVITLLLLQKRSDVSTLSWMDEIKSLSHQTNF
jgi:SAM-dependent methyltransferase